MSDWVREAYQNNKKPSQEQDNKWADYLDKRCIVPEDKGLVL